MTRLVLVLICVVVILLVVLGMRLGWRNRRARQSGLGALPTVPRDLGVPLLRASGVYVGTSFASSWQDRVVHGGLGDRAVADADLYPAGLVLHRQGGTAIFVPASSWIEARLAPGLAGKVVGEGGLLVVRWHLGKAELDTGFLADDKSTYPDFVRAINRKVNA